MCERMGYLPGSVKACDICLVPRMHVLSFFPLHVLSVLPSHVLYALLPDRMSYHCHKYDVNKLR
jgi:hypothetical protein